MGLTWRDTYAKGRDRYVQNKDGDSGPIALTDEEADLRNRVYASLGERVTLTREHQGGLLSRHLDSGHIYSDGYFSVEEMRDRDIDRLYLELSEALFRVPGFHRDVAGRPRFSPRAGLVIPVRDESRRIIAGQVRTGGDPKYLWLRGSGSPPHVPLCVTPGETVWVTEGPLKADVAATLSGLPVVAVAGVSAWRSILPALVRWGTRRVVLAFDADQERKAEVLMQAGAFAGELARRGLAVARAVWEEKQGKGLDDLLINGFSPKVMELSNGRKSESRQGQPA
jgi:hypothetical protein